MAEQESGKRSASVLQNLREDRQNVSRERGVLKAQFHGAYSLFPPGWVLDYFDFIDEAILACFGQWKREQIRLPVDGDSIGVDPAAVNEVYVIEQHDLVDRRHKLE